MLLCFRGYGRQCTGCGNCALNFAESVLKLARPPERIPDAGAPDDAEFPGLLIRAAHRAGEDH